MQASWKTTMVHRDTAPRRIRGPLGHRRPARVRARISRTARPLETACRVGPVAVGASRSLPSRQCVTMAGMDEPGPSGTESVRDSGTETDLVTGAFSYSGSRIAELLIESGREVRTLTGHPQRPHPLQARVEASPYRFDDRRALARSLEGVTTLYNTYWVRFERGGTTFASAVANSRALFEAARRARVARIVHLSIANPSVDSPLPYFRGKALVEQALAAGDVPYSIVRPTWIFGGGRDILANNIAWILRHMPIFVVPGDGHYLVQPVHVDDLAHICLRAGHRGSDIVMDAAGPDTMSFEELVRAVGHAVGRHTPILHASSAGMVALSLALGFLLRDVVVTADEIRGLIAGLLVSHQPALGSISFVEWLNENGPTLGRAYLSELNRHFRS